MKVMKARSIKMQLVWFIFLITLSSALLTGFLLFIFHRIRVVDITLLGRTRFPFPVMVGTLFAVSTFFGTCLSYGFSKKILQPIQDLINATNEIKNGNYNVRVADTEVEKEFEIGKLIQSFNDMAQELASVEMLKTDFINYFSHEFKTPIISIRGFAKQLQQDNLSEIQRQEYGEIIYKESERLVKLSANVLLLTRLENQTLVTGKRKFLLDEQLRHCILLLQKEWEVKNLELNLDLEEISYEGNEEMLSQVWINLIGNAIQYSRENGRLFIKCKRDGDRVKIKIKDDGKGMTDKTLLNIFDKFYQGDLSHTTEGNGLGLSIVKRIVELCEGSITVKSQLDKGSVFIVYLPYEPKIT